MSLINIPGMTEDSILKTDVAATGGPGLKPFPCDGSGWTRQTGSVLKAALKIFENGGENISIVMGNGPFGGEILINLDTTQVPPGCQDVAKAEQENLTTLVKAIKVLGAHTNGKLDTSKLEKARGMNIEFICRHKGFNPGRDGKQFHKISYIFKGGIPDIEPVDEHPRLPDLPGTGAAPARAAYQGDPLAGDW